MQNIDLTQLHQQLERLIGHCYKQYREMMSEEERKLCEDNIYKYGEYEEALTNLVGILNEYGITLDVQCRSNIEKAAELMKINLE